MAELKAQEAKEALEAKAAAAALEAEADAQSEAGSKAGSKAGRGRGRGEAKGGRRLRLDEAVRASGYMTAQQVRLRGEGESAAARLCCSRS